MIACEYGRYRGDVMHPGVHLKRLNPLKTTEFCAGARADAERDGVALPDLDRCIADTVGYAPVKERSSERNALELSACTQSTIQSTEHRR